ncbi:hypothetical protein IMSAGC022_00230 [Alistipes sp.]|nr:hypothetical protein IMSAGC022_00230 [Alistipes sp.]
MIFRIKYLSLNLSEIRRLDNNTDKSAVVFGLCLSLILLRNIT